VLVSLSGLLAIIEVVCRHNSQAFYDQEVVGCYRVT